ncbi:unnamed protein product [Rotaria sp. Silwood2]|nr:unnamed protein product [Rotaria sp. Silwood2]CAF4175613.1 unnamed protein product [Rotaria sp. Silwood2]
MPRTPRCEYVNCGPIFDVHQVREVSGGLLRTLAPQFFQPMSCPNSTMIGTNCNISNNLCDMMDPCLNGGTCSTDETNTLSFCSCSKNFSGTHCEINNHPCKPYTSLDHETSNSTLYCMCNDDW